MIALAVFAFGVLAWATGLLMDLTPLRLAAKPVPVLALLAWVRPRSERWLLVGLACSAAGDFVMELGRDAPYFLAGMAAFGLAHVSYTAAFVARSRAWRLATLLPFVVWGAILMLRLWPGLGGLRVPVAAYAALLLVMMWRAVAASLATASWSTAAGAIAFGISDSLIAFDRFVGPVPAARWLVMTTYWAGQLGIAAARPRPCVTAAPGSIPART